MKIEELKHNTINAIAAAIAIAKVAGYTEAVKDQFIDLHGKSVEAAKQAESAVEEALENERDAIELLAARRPSWPTSSGKSIRTKG